MPNDVDIRLKVITEGQDQLRALDAATRTYSQDLVANTEALRSVQLGLERLSISLAEVRVKHVSASAAAREYGLELNVLTEQVARFGAAAKLASGASMFGGLTALLGGGALVMMMGEFLKKTQEQAIELQHLSVATGVSAVKLAEYQLVLKESGVHVDNLGPMFQRLGRSVAQASEGVASAKHAWAELGINTSDWAKHAPDLTQALQLVATGMGNTKNEANVLAATTTLLGRGQTAQVAALREQGVHLTENMNRHREAAQAMADAGRAAELMKEQEARLDEELVKLGSNTIPHLLVMLYTLKATFKDIGAYFNADLWQGIAATVNDATVAPWRLGADTAQAAKGWAQVKKEQDKNTDDLAKDLAGMMTQGVHVPRTGASAAGGGADAEAKKQAEILKEATREVQAYTRASGEALWNSPWAKLTAEYDKMYQAIEKVTDAKQRHLLVDKLNAGVAEREVALMEAERKKKQELAQQQETARAAEELRATNGGLQPVTTAQLMQRQLGSMIGPGPAAVGNIPQFADAATHQEQQLRLLKQAEESQIRMIQLQSTDEMQAANLVYQARMRFIAEEKAAGMDAFDAKMQQLDAEAAKQQAVAQVAADKQKKQAEDVRNEAEAIFGGILHHNLGDVMKQQGEQILTHMVGNLAQNVFTPNKGGGGGIATSLFRGTPLESMFGGKQDHGAQAMDMAAMKHQAAAFKLAASAGQLSAAATRLSSSGGGGGGTGGGLLKGFSGGGGGGGGYEPLGTIDDSIATSDSPGGTSFMSAGDSGSSFGGSDFTEGTGLGSGGGIGGSGMTAGGILGAAGGAFQAYSGFKKGGAKGDISGVAGVMTTAAMLDPEPISKIALMAGAGVLDLVTAFMGDPKVQRQKEETRALEAANEAGSKYTMTPQHLTMDSFGHAAIADLRGVGYTSTGLTPRLADYNEITGWDPYHKNMTTSRSQQRVDYAPWTSLDIPPAAKAPATTVNVTVHTIDSKSFLDHSDNIASALSKALMGTHRISGDIRNVAGPK